MRKVLDQMLCEIAQTDKKVIVVVGDIGHGIFDNFKNSFPDRFFNFGICEQSMISAASGIALEGLRPWVYTITPFLIERPFEQVKLDIDKQNVNVKLIGYADYPTEGPTHSEIDAPWLMSKFENIVSYFPKSSEETKDAIISSYSFFGPNFISLKKDKNIRK
jgi:transketolase